MTSCAVRKTHPNKHDEHVVANVVAFAVLFTDPHSQCAIAVQHQRTVHREVRHQLADDTNSPTLLDLGSRKSKKSLTNSESFYTTAQATGPISRTKSSLFLISTKENITTPSEMLTVISRHKDGNVPIPHSNTM